MYVVKYETPTKAQKIARKFFANVKVDETCKYFNNSNDAIRFARCQTKARIHNAWTNQEVKGW